MKNAQQTTKSLSDASLEMNLTLESFDHAMKLTGLSYEEAAKLLSAESGGKGSKGLGSLGFEDQKKQTSPKGNGKGNGQKAALYQQLLPALNAKLAKLKKAMGGKKKGPGGGAGGEIEDAETLLSVLADKILESESQTEDDPKGKSKSPGTTQSLKESSLAKDGDKAPKHKTDEPLKDDPGTEKFCLERVKPDDEPELRAQAQDKVDQIRADKELSAKYRALSVKELHAVIMYTTNAAYPINFILRGLLRTPKWTKPFGKYVDVASVGLKKLPDGARNYQGKNATLDTFEAASGKKQEKMLPGMSGDMIDPKKKAGETVRFDTVYRNMFWSPPLESAFQNEYKVGRNLQDPGFMSTTLIKDSYAPDAPVKWTINNVKGAKSLLDLSVYESEKEALLPPGQRMRIDEIHVTAPGKGRRACKDPMTAYPSPNATARNSYKRDGTIWEMSLTHVGGFDKEQKKKSDEGAAGPDLLERMMAKAPKL